MMYVLSPGAAIVGENDISLTVRLPSGDVALQGRTAALAQGVLRAVERPNSVDEVARDVVAPVAKVARLLALLESQGIVTTLAELDRGPGVDRPANTALSLFPDGGSCAAEVDGVRAEVVCVGDEELGERFAELTTGSIDVRLSRRPVLDEADSPALREPAPALVVSLARDRDNERLRVLDSWSRRAGVPYLAGWFEGPTALLTHVVVPWRTACYDCLCTRERAAVPAPGTDGPDADEAAVDAPEQLAPDAGDDGPPVGLTSAGRLVAGDGLLANLAALRAINVFVGRTNEIPAPTLLQLSFTTLKLTRHPVLRVPTCESCSR